MPSPTPSPSPTLTDLDALRDAFGLLASISGYFPLMLAFGLLVATVFALKADSYA